MASSLLLNVTAPRAFVVCYTHVLDTCIAGCVGFRVHALGRELYQYTWSGVSTGLLRVGQCCCVLCQWVRVGMPCEAPTSLACLRGGGMCKPFTIFDGMPFCRLEGSSMLCRVCCCDNTKEPACCMNCRAALPANHAVGASSAISCEGSVLHFAHWCCSNVVGVLCQ
jgi:hypothetical protein